MNETALVAVILLPGLAILGATTWWVTKIHARDGASPNAWVGLRTRATKSSPEAWVRAHRAAVPVANVIVRGSLLAAGVVLLLVLGSLALDALAVLALGVSAASFLLATGGCLYACLVADRAARAHVSRASRS